MKLNKITVIYLSSISREIKTTKTCAVICPIASAPRRQEIRDDATRAMFLKIRALDLLDRISRC